MTSEDYIQPHSSPEPETLRNLIRETHLRLVHGRMCSGHIQGRLLKMLTTMIRPLVAVELGTFTGYSALCIAEGLPEGGKLITIEHQDELEDFLKRSFNSSPFADVIDLRIGDALDICRSMESASADMMFMDADKRQYPEYFQEALRIVRPGGFIIADNTLWDGHVVEPSHADDPQTAGILRFNRMVAESDRCEEVMIPLRDGLTLIRILPV